MLGDIDLSRDFLLKSLDISNKQYREKHYSSGNILFYLGNTYRSSGDLGKARENYELAKDVLQQHYGNGYFLTKKVEKAIEDLDEENRNK